MDERRYTSRSARGAASELFTCAYLLAKGYHVFRSESPSCPFDLIAYREGVYARVEVKSLSRKTEFAPTFTWPSNDEWDLLIVVDEDGSCIEVQSHDQHEARKVIRQALGLRPIHQVIKDEMQVRKVIALRDAGESIRSVATQLGMSVGTVANVCRSQHC